ncbi:MAG: uracil-xanthine permease family protein, partial [Bacteroidales bacterium]
MKEETLNKGLIYRVDQKPPVKDAIFVALQLILSVFVAIITPPLIIAGALNLDIETTGFLVSMALFAAGICTFIQCHRIGPLGVKLLSVQGASFTFIGPIIAAGSVGGLSLIFGSAIAASTIEMFISRILKYAQKIITPLVSGIVVSLIGLTLIKVGIISCGGGFAAKANGTFGSLENIGLSVLVLVLIVLCNMSRNKYIRMSSILIGLLAGYIAAYFMGKLDLSMAKDLTSFSIPVPFKFGLSFDWSTFLSFALIYLVTSVEAYGSITGNSIISEEPIEGEVYNKRVASGIFAEGVNSMIAGVFNAFPNSLYSQTVGVIQLSGVASRYVGYYVAAALVLLGLFPGVGILFS